MLLIFAGCVNAQKTAEERKDSLSRVSVRTRHGSEKPVYLLDSIALMNARVFNKIAQHTQYVQFVKSQNGLAYFYARTGGTIVIDGKIAYAQTDIFDTRNCKTVKLKRISSARLFKNFGAVNKNGGINSNQVLR
jgi:hypothetical protein